MDVKKNIDADNYDWYDTFVNNKLHFLVLYFASNQHYSH